MCSSRTEEEPDKEKMEELPRQENQERVAVDK